MSSASYDGIYKAIVVDNDDPLHAFRVVCQVPQVLADAYSNWCEPLLPTLYTQRIGETVWVQFIDGDPTQPVYMSRVVVTSEMIDPTTTFPPGSIADLSLEVIKFKNTQHYLF